jgi:hypothetical protein
VTQITLNPGQLQQLPAGQTLVECRDPAGKLVGYLHVSGNNGPAQYPDFTADQLAAYEQEPGGRSLTDILTDLRKR